MAERKPLVLDSANRMAELPAGDTISSADVVQLHAIIDDAGGFIGTDSYSVIHGETA